jgi:hypothetical protein
MDGLRQALCVFPISQNKLLNVVGFITKDRADWETSGKAGHEKVISLT